MTKRRLVYSVLASILTAFGLRLYFWLMEDANFRARKPTSNHPAPKYRGFI